MQVALVTGASRGLGRVLTLELASRDWHVVVDARNGTALQATLGDLEQVSIVPGDVTEAAHRDDLKSAIRRLGRLDLLVNNASVLGPSPQPTLARYPLDELERVYRNNVVGPLALIQLLVPELVRTAGSIVNVTSDAAVEPYEGWGGYGSSKAALDQLTAILGAEQREFHVYAFDPGDMRTALHQEAFPGEDISDRPEPETVVPALLRLVEERPPSGRYRASDLLVAAGERT